jgi:hypothetical protein
MGDPDRAGASLKLARTSTAEAHHAQELIQ